MKKLVNVLKSYSFWVSLLIIASMIGLIISDSIKDLWVFGVIYLGACIQAKGQ